MLLLLSLLLLLLCVDSLEARASTREGVFIVAGVWWCRG
jgi:hypothetical protein